MDSETEEEIIMKVSPKEIKDIELKETTMIAGNKILQTGESMKGKIIVEEMVGKMIMIDEAKLKGIILETTGTIGTMIQMIGVTDFLETKTTTNRDKMTIHQKVSNYRTYQDQHPNQGLTPANHMVSTRK